MLISAYDKTDKLREMRTRGREGVKNPKNFAYVLNGSPLTGKGRCGSFPVRSPPGFSRQGQHDPGLDRETRGGAGLIYAHALVASRRARSTFVAFRTAGLRTSGRTRTDGEAESRTKAKREAAREKAV